MQVKTTLKDTKCILEKKHYTDAGWDLKSNSDTFTLAPSRKKLVSTGVKLEIPRGYVGLVFPRSGLGTKYEVGLANTVGVIDSDYRGEILVFLTNKGDKEVKIEKYDRFAQIVFVPVLLGDVLVVAELGETERGSGGLGSTGK